MKCEKPTAQHTKQQIGGGGEKKIVECKTKEAQKTKENE